MPMRKTPPEIRTSRDRGRLAGNVAQNRQILGQLQGVAHDLNNFLVVIEGNARLLAATFDPTDPGNEITRSIAQAAEGASALVGQLRQLGANRGEEARLLRFNLNRAVKSFSPVLEGLIGGNVRLEVRLGRNVGSVRMAPGQIEQILMNLATNARDAMPGGGTLTLSTTRVAGTRKKGGDGDPGGYCVLTVSDSGVGMSEGVLARLFEPSFTTKENGSGQGMANVDGIVQGNGGHIRVTSVPGVGSTFDIFLPRQATSAPKLRRRRRPARKETGAASPAEARDEEPMPELVAAAVPG